MNTKEEQENIRAYMADGHLETARERIYNFFYDLTNATIEIGLCYVLPLILALGLVSFPFWTIYWARKVAIH